MGHEFEKKNTANLPGLESRVFYTGSTPSPETFGILASYLIKI